MTMILFKIALAIFYFRIVVRTWQKWTVYSVVAVSTTYGLFYASILAVICIAAANLLQFFIVLFRCGDPPDYLENQLEGKCFSNELLYGINMAAGVINAATDWALAILPIFVLRRADLNLRTRLAVCFVLMLGSLGSIVSVVRLPYIEGLAMGPNFFRGAVDITIWSVIEPGFGITAACLVTLRPLFTCVGENRSEARSRTAPNPTPSEETMVAARTRPASFSTWRTDHVKDGGWDELEMQHQLPARPTFQDRLNYARAEEDARTSMQLSRTRPAPPSVYSDRSYSISVKSGEARNFSRPTPMPILTAQHPVPPMPAHTAPLPPMPAHPASMERRMSERAAMAWEQQHHSRHESLQTLF